MNKLIFILIILTGFISPHIVQSQNYTITVTITGLHSDKGKVMLSLYNSEDGYPKGPKKAYRLTSSPITNNMCTIVLTDIPKGTYAIACFHDENNNGKLDTNFLGIPNEGTGASNNAKGSMGPPKFKDAKFVVDKDVSISIKIAY
jgi:uncharacterized protein (DUF2141 family)